MKGIIKGIYNEKVHETKEFKSYEEAEEYTYKKYNAVYDVDLTDNGNTAIFYVYQR